MRVSIIAPFWPCPLEKALEEMCRAGYKYIELRLRGADKTSDEDVRHIKNLFEDMDLKMVAVLWMAEFSLGDPDAEKRRISVQQWKNAIRTTKKLGCNLLTPELGGNPLYRTECAKAFKKSAEELSPILEKEEITIAFEPHPGDFIQESNETVDLIRETGCGNIGYLYCTPHTFVLGGSDASSMIRYAGDTLKHVHVADTHKADRIIAPPTVRAHEHLIPGEGEIRFEEIFQTLKEIGYESFLSVKIYSHQDKPIEAAMESKKRLEKLMSDL